MSWNFDDDLPDIADGFRLNSPSFKYNVMMLMQIERKGVQTPISNITENHYLY